MPNRPLQDPAPKPRRPRRSLRRLLVIAIAVVVVPAGAFTLWGHVEQSRLDRALDAIEARGEPLDAATLDPEPVTPEQRTAAGYYADAIRRTAAVPAVNFALANPPLRDLCTPPLGGPAQEARAETLRRLEEPYAAALDLIDKAAAIDARGYDRANRPQFVMAERPLANVNVLRIARRACTGDGDGAATALLSTLRMRRIEQTAPLGSRMRTEHGLRSILTFTAPSTALLEMLQREYTAAADDRAAERLILAARAFYLRYMVPGEFGDRSPRRLNPLEAVAFGLSQPFRTHALVTELHEYDEIVEASRQSWPAAWESVAILKAKYPFSNQRPGFIDAFIGAGGPHSASRQYSFIVTAEAASLASTRASIGVLAIARYRLAHDGALPPSLRDLVPAYLAAPLIDPYTGRELSYRRLADAYKVYSVGPDGTDDGGLWVSGTDLGYGVRGISKDTGIAVGQWPTEAVGK